MRLKFLGFLIAYFCILSAHAQQSWSVRTNAGIASKAELADGYYFSFDVGIPLTRYLQIAPTFSFASIGSGNFMAHSLTTTSDFPAYSYGVPLEGPESEYEFQDVMGSVNILLLFNPIMLFKKEPGRHELLIGTGYGYKSYTQVSASYIIDRNGYELRSFQSKANSGFELYYLKLMYNYAFRENLFVGAVVGIDGYDGEGTTNIGLQFGVRF